MVNLTYFLAAVAEPGHIVAKFIEALYQSIGNYGWTVVVFTLILKAAMSPLDVWQKVAMHKNNKAMERMKPDLEKLQKQCGGNKELYQQKQMQLYKKEGYSMLGSCLPTIVTLVLFFVIFAGFRAEVKYTNEYLYDDMRSTYYSTLESTGSVDEAKSAVEVKFEDEYSDKIGFLWIENIFMPDSWKKPIADYSTYTGTKLGALGATDYYSDPASLNSALEKEGETGYNEVMSVLMTKYNRWNGYLILPILTVLLSVLSQKLNKPMQPPSAPSAGGAETQAAMEANMKMMQYMMPAMMGIFAIFYSSAFTLYMFTSSVFSTVFQFVYNLVAKAKDKRNEEIRLKTTYK